MIDQHCAIARGSIEIAGQEGDGACPLAQHAAKSQGMPDGAPLLDVVLDYSQRLVGKPLQPKNASLKIMRRNPHIEPQADNFRSLCQPREIRQHAVDMQAGIGLVTDVMQRRGKDAISHEQIDRIV